jgi:hypothetical protein
MIQIFVNDFLSDVVFIQHLKNRLKIPSFQQVYMTCSFVSTFFGEVSPSVTVHVCLCPEAIQQPIPTSVDGRCQQAGYSGLFNGGTSDQCDHIEVDKEVSHRKDYGPQRCS